VAHTQPSRFEFLIIAGNIESGIRPLPRPCLPCPYSDKTANFEHLISSDGASILDIFRQIKSDLPWEWKKNNPAVSRVEERFQNDRG
jgi:hypothetical protein